MRGLRRPLRCGIVRSSWSPSARNAKSSGVQVIWMSSPRSMTSRSRRFSATGPASPCSKLTEEETARLLRMEDELHKRIIGQEDAVRLSPKRSRRTRAGLGPEASVGIVHLRRPVRRQQTELSKALAEFLFGDDDALIQIDMGEFHDRYTASRLFGAPPDTSATKRAVSSRRRSEGSRSVSCFSMRSKRRTWRSTTRCCRFSRMVVSPMVRVHGRLQEHRADLHVEPGYVRHLEGGWSRLHSGRGREQLRADEAKGQRRGSRSISGLVPQPHRRHHRVPSADSGRDHRDGRSDGESGQQTAENQDMEMELTPKAKACWPSAVSTRPWRASAASDDQREIEDALSERSCSRRSVRVSW